MGSNPTRGSMTKYNSRYDSEYDTIIDEWTQELCTTPDCYFCEARPERPSLCTEFLDDGQPHVEHD